MVRTLLHGTLHIKISKKDEQNTTGNSNDLLTRAQQLGRMVANPFKEVQYVTIDLEGAQVGSFVVGSRETVHHVYCAHKASKITFTAYVQFHISKGTDHVPIDEDILAGREKSILLTSKAPNILVKLKFFPPITDPNWGGISSGKFGGVANTSFQQKDRCKVSLYQDAHVPLTAKIDVRFSANTYQPQRCWKDIYDAINDAKHIIYIEGWSLHPEIVLVRDDAERATKLGKLLKQKAEEGVTVLMLIWNDLFSKMGTRSEKTVQYFRSNTKVHCVACPEQLFGIQNLLKRYIYSHHQKTVVVDIKSPSGEDKREIVAFVGGIDLCGGRYDTPHHSLFSTLNSEHKDDFYQGNFPSSVIENGGPRQPWHDIHARVEGSVAWDVLRNFKQRWERRGVKDINPKELDEDIFMQPPLPFLEGDNNGSWNVQLFRSGDGADFELQNTNYDRSIQDAYINAIRGAKRFIYIESQYFIGSSFAWDVSDGGINPAEFGAVNLIPKELSLKIVSKIKAKERFTVYIVIPMWPEGVPEDDLVQALLDLQRRTMQMMYKDVIEALNAEGVKEDPRNYLTFFCLGKREMNDSIQQELSPSNKMKRAGKQSNSPRARDSQRFMIYVHSKMMIVDDEYIMIGSSNINQRSMDGARDTEVSIGAYQPNHLATDPNAPARGQIHGFRKSLWFEHLGMFLPCFNNPESEKCVRVVNRLATINWKKYCQENLVELPGRLLPYPVHISEDGTITALEALECFPDTNAPILGKLNTNWLLQLPEVVLKQKIIVSQIWSIII